MLRSPLALALATIGASVLVALAPTATAAPSEYATITWSTDADEVRYGDSLTVTVSGTWPDHGPSDPDAETIFASLSGSGAYGWAELRPEDPTRTFEVPTDEIGEFKYRVTAHLDDDATTLLAKSIRTIAVTGEPTDLDVTWPEQKRVGVGAALQASGTVTGGARKIRIEQKTVDGSWATLASTTSSRDGTWSVAIPTGWLAKHRLRAVAPAVGSLDPDTQGTKRIVVAPSYRPKPSAKSYEFTGYRWDSCAGEIRYRVNTKRMPKGLLPDVHKAFGIIEEATGLDFTYVGSTSVVPWKGTTDKFAKSPPLKDADFAVGWATPKQVPRFKGRMAPIGLGGASWAWTVRDMPSRAVEGQVAFKARIPVKKGWGPGGYGALMLHEIAHAVGLDHTNDLRQIMYPGLSPRGAARLGAGDLEGLRRVGRAAACYPKDSARPSSRAAITPRPHSVFITQ